MKTIIITGPSGSGKSYLSNKLSKLFNNSIVIKTDSYYRDNIFIRLLSIFLYDIYDRPFSIKKNELKKILKSLDNNVSPISFYKYDYKIKHSSQSNISIKYKGESQFLIVEGIFAHRLNLNYRETINIVCQEQKHICFKRRLIRDQLERGRDSSEVYKKFNKSWFLFFKNVEKYLNNNKVISIHPPDKITYNKLILNLQNEQKNNQEK
tara:strand:+ start:239 stop:862 length:624 start_codon:yes stop_codon:yes gene_type:complete